jgi:hypothetical protein
MVRMIALVLTLLAIATKTRAMTEARLISKSSSGRTALFSLGTHDGVANGDFAVIAKQIRSVEERNLRVVPVARARNIKISPDSSVWILYKVYDSELLVKGDKFILLAESHLLRGRRDPEVGKTTVVTQDTLENQQTKYILEDDKDRLAKRTEDYDTLAITRDGVVNADTDADQIDVEKWGRQKNVRHRVALFKGPNQKEFKKRLRLSTFEKLVTAYLKRVNDPDFNYDAFYEASRRTDFANEFKVRSDIENEYQKYLSAESRRTSADAKLFRAVLLKGESWSEDYSDEELRRVLNEVSVLQETERRDFVGARPNRYNLAFDYGMILTDAQTDRDPGYRRDGNRSFEVDFEAIPFVKHKQLERFSINSSFRLARSAFEADSFNADVDEYSVTLGANWYPVHAPYAIEAPVFLLGAYIRSGYARVVAPTPDEKANYTVLSMPGLRAGMKYLLRNNFGLRLIFSMETLKLEQYESSKLDSILPSSTNLVEGKFGIGITYGF